ncbi:MAG: NAD(+) diphosphatase [Bacteroidaceae bacterium]|nr:NAD(+) diphosphatase [Bacteroidaceae bacterium]
MKFETEISKRCTNCGKELWPQLATAVIVRVTRYSVPGKSSVPGQGSVPSSKSSVPGQGSVPSSKSSEPGQDSVLGGLSPEEVLLVRAHNFRGPHYGLVAGFVETGETLEEAVRREVREETGIEIANIRYFGSQPWPYPCGLMVGFTADYVSGDIRLQRSELSAGDWFTRDQLPPIPGKASIARRLIDDWLEQR